MDMDMDMGMNHNSSSSTHSQFTHMTFFWGKDAEILFSGWPGGRTGMYVLALIIVFVLSILLEWLSFLCNSYYAASSSEGDQGVAGDIWRIVLHGVRMAFAYLLMLAVMSFNIGVLLVAVAGHVVGFGAFERKRRPVPTEGEHCGHPSASPLGC